MRWIELEGAHNVRDLGGLPAAGGTTRDRVALRADALDALTPNDVVTLRGMGLARVIDLRSAAERVERGRGLLGDTDVAYSPLDVVDEAVLAQRQADRAAAFAAGTQPEVIISNGYVQLLELGGPAFRAAFELVARTGSAPTLFHCAAGKDRTGVLAALLLDAARVDRDAIVDDYAATQERLDAIFRRLAGAEAYEVIVERLPVFVMEARPGTMRRFLTLLDEGWGGSAGYLEAQGVAPTTIDSWRDSFVA